MLDGLEKALTSVTKEWKNEMRQADRQDRLSSSRLARLSQRYHETTIKEAAYEVMEQAYHKAAGHINTANARQIMYKARPLVLELTGGKCWSKSSYFTQHLLPDFMEENPEVCADWDVAFDARGHFAEPHTRRVIDLGTYGVREYIADWHDVTTEEPSWTPSYRVKTSGPGNRFSAALFLEKEGFNQLLSAADIARRFDLAIMSTKGMSVTAARTLVERLSRDGVQVLVAHDFDKAGFSIISTLQRDTRRYRFTGTPNVVDIGLRLTDVEAMSLDSEEVECGPEDAYNLEENGAEPDEIDFLTNGQRVELNAMDSDQFIEWLEEKLRENDVEKVVPDPETLARTYRWAVRLARAEEAVAEALAAIAKQDIEVPDDLEDKVREYLEDQDKSSWDGAVAVLAGGHESEEDDGDDDPDEDGEEEQ